LHPGRNVAGVGIERTRWAAVGAAIAVTLGAGGLGIVRATAPDGASAYVPISPCRLVDTRASAQVGPQAGPLVGPDVEITVDGWGDVAGDCSLPADTTGLQLNVTAVDASQLTNLRFYPEGANTPTASNLNPAPGQPPTPNAVAVSLNPSNGKFHVFNRFGSVHVVIDVLGYFTDHDHDDRYYRKTEADWPIRINGNELEGLPNTIRRNDGPLLMPQDVDSTFVYGFALPATYPAGTDLQIDLDWYLLTGARPCGILLFADSPWVARPGSPVVNTPTAWSDPIAPDEPWYTDLQPTVDNEVVATVSFTVSGAGLQPGDWISGAVQRAGSTPTDTCNGRFVPVGLDVVLAG
jgi:hypothetical protein